MSELNAKARPKSMTAACPQCGTVVWFGSDGVCPACGSYETGGAREVRYRPGAEKQGRLAAFESAQELAAERRRRQQVLHGVVWLRHVGVGLIVLGVVVGAVSMASEDRSGTGGLSWLLLPLAGLGLLRRYHQARRLADKVD